MSLEAIQATIRVERASRVRRTLVPRIQQEAANKPVQDARDAFEAEVARRQIPISLRHIEEEIRHVGRNLVSLLDVRERLERAQPELERMARITERATQDIDETERSVLTALVNEASQRIAVDLPEEEGLQDLLEWIDLDSPENIHRSQQTIDRLRSRLTGHQEQFDAVRDELLDDLAYFSHERRLHFDPAHQLPATSLEQEARDLALQLTEDPLSARRAQAHIPRGVALHLLD
ncbi:MAG: hypothetical protein QF752_00745 [Planctomycetota bacterium]|nr:hypothetical protein [Planctomycetota bacterium]